MRRSITKGSKDTGQTRIVKTDTGGILLRFSFKYFDKSDEEMCPRKFPDAYVPVLVDRLKHLEGWTVQTFLTTQSKSSRNHHHDWHKTSGENQTDESGLISRKPDGATEAAGSFRQILTTRRPLGFENLPANMKDYEGWQFCLTANPHFSNLTGASGF